MKVSLTHSLGLSRAVQHNAILHFFIRHTQVHDTVPLKKSLFEVNGLKMVQRKRMNRV